MVRKDYIKYLRFIFNNFGEENQWKKLAEELAEVLCEIARGDRKLSIEEMADVEVVWDGLKLFALNKNEQDRFVRQKEKKVCRTTKRIQEGYYDKKEY